MHSTQPDNTKSIYVTNYINHNQNFLPLTSQSVSEAFFRRNLLSFLPVLAALVMRRDKKSVLRVAQRVAALVPTARMPSLLPDVYRFWKER